MLQHPEFGEIELRANPNDPEQCRVYWRGFYMGELISLDGWTTAGIPTVGTIGSPLQSAVYLIREYLNKLQLDRPDLYEPLMASLEAAKAQSEFESYIEEMSEVLAPEASMAFVETTFKRQVINLLEASGFSGVRVASRQDFGLSTRYTVWCDKGMVCGNRMMDEVLPAVQGWIKAENFNKGLRNRVMAQYA